jgi:hypothetical protein
LPLFAATHFPSMKSFRSLLKYAAAAELRAGLSVVMVIVILFQAGFIVLDCRDILSNREDCLRSHTDEDPSYAIAAVLAESAWKAGRHARFVHGVVQLHPPPRD